MTGKISTSIILSAGALLLAALLGAGTAFGLDSYSEHFRAGLEQLRAGDAASAAEEFERALALGPDQAKIQHSLGLVLMERTNPPQPARLQQLLEQLPDHAQSRDSLYWLARAYEALGNHDQAGAALARSLDKPAGTIPTATIRALQSKLAGSPSSSTKPSWVEILQNLVVVAAILVIAFLFILALKKFVFGGEDEGEERPRAFSTHDVLFFLVIVVLLGFAALAFGWIDGGEFISAIQHVLGVVGTGTGH